MQAPAQSALAAGTRTANRTWTKGAITAATMYWPDYPKEAACLGLFMVSACSVATLLQACGFAIQQMLSNQQILRRMKEDEKHEWSH